VKKNPSANTDDRRIANSEADLTISLLERFSSLCGSVRAVMDERVIGQAEGKSSLMRLLHRVLYQNRTDNPGAPAGAVVFVGPTGCGKTFLVETFAKALRPGGSGKAPLIRINCAEYQNHHEVARLIGAPPGYLGHRETEPVLGNTRLKEAAGRSITGSPVILFDEIDKAHASVLDILLGILEGHLALGDNTPAPLGGSFIVFTSNYGSTDMYRTAPGLIDGSRLAFSEPGSLAARYRETIRKNWRPELVNRISEIVGFRALTRDEIVRIAERKIREFAESLVVPVTFSDPPGAIAEHIVSNYDIDLRYGARDLKRAIARAIEDRVFELVSQSKLPVLGASPPLVRELSIGAAA
jgi:ATP-dependent Clp protease ATP-binding subunit ClpA